MPTSTAIPTCARSGWRSRSSASSRARSASWASIRPAPSAAAAPDPPPSGGVMQDHPEGEALAGPEPADAMAQRHPVGAAGALRRPVVDGEDHRLALDQRHELAARLRPRPLLDQQELAAGEIDARP